MSDTDRVYKDKGDITRVGGFDADGRPTGWTFENAKDGIQIFFDGRPTLYGGYTIDELRAISAGGER